MLLMNYEKSQNFKMKQVVLDEEILINLDTNGYSVFFFFFANKADIPSLI